MKKYNLFTGTIIILLGSLILNACDKPANGETGFVTFGANYHIIDCITTVTIYVDDTEIGTLTNPTDTIIDCGEDSNITEEISIGAHTYKVEIRPVLGTGCTWDINGTFTIAADSCEKIFIDYRGI